MCPAFHSALLLKVTECPAPLSPGWAPGRQPLLQKSTATWQQNVSTSNRCNFHLLKANALPWSSSFSPSDKRETARSCSSFSPSEEHSAREDDKATQWEESRPLNEFMDPSLRQLYWGLNKPLSDLRYCILGIPLQFPELWACECLLLC